MAESPLPQAQESTGWPRAWRQHSRAQRLWSLLWLAILVFGVVRSLQQAWVSDDIYITFRYTENVLDGFGPVYNPGEKSEGYTHFIWFVVLTMGRMLGIEAHLLGKYLAIPAFIGILFLLLRISQALFPGRGGLWGIPLAALAWALHEDTQLFASGGLETSFYILLLLIGFYFLTVSRHRRADLLAAWAYAIATLARPEGLLYSGLAGVFLFWRSDWNWQRTVRFGGLWLALVVPLFAFRLSYYGYPFPNPYYAKSGGVTNWPQGIVYLRTYFECYFFLLLSLVATWPIARHLLRRRQATDLTPAAAPLALAFVSALLNVFYVTRVGGDFMFARFFLPATAFLLLLIEFLVHHLPRASVRVAATFVLLGLLVVGITFKHFYFGDKEDVWGIVDEPQYYPDQRLDEVRGMARAIRQCIGNTNATVMVQGGQAALAYYGRFPIAVERYGLTDEHIAHGPTPVIRGRPGHEKFADAGYIYDRGVNLRFHFRLVRSLPQFVLFGIPGPNGIVSGEIIVYDRELMDELKRCRGIRFLDFPLWLERDYLPNIETKLPLRVARDYNLFKRYYFNHNPDPERLLQRLEVQMARLGIEKVPDEPLAPDHFADTGRPTQREETP